MGVMCTASASAEARRSADVSPWQVVSRLGRSFGFDVAFSDAQHGWAGAHRDPRGAGVYRTSDGGRTWEWVAIPGVPADAEDPRTGGVACHGRNVWVFCAYEVQPGDVTTERTYGFLARSQNGGLTWTIKVMDAETMDGSVHFGTMHFANPRDGWITALRLDPLDGAWHERFLLVTHDGGRTWARSGLMRIGQFTDRRYEAFAFVGPRHVWTAHLDWPLQASHDGGRTWALLSLPWWPEWGEAPYGEHGAPYIRSFCYVVTDLSFVDARHGWAVLIEEDDDHQWLAVEHSEDGGVTWDEQFRITDEHPVASWAGLEFTNAREGFLAFENRIMATTDGGETWVTEYEGGVGIGTRLVSAGGRVWLMGVDDEGRVLLRRD
jgi:photosystem II stability/assembly factor-like uncharacterized protein